MISPNETRGNFQLLADRPHNYWFPLIVAALGVGSLLMIAAIDWIRGRAEIQTEQVRALDQIQIKIAVSHLWVEEYVSGDIVDRNEIRRNIDEATMILDKIESAAPEDPWIFAAREQAPVAETVRSAKLELERFAEISRARLLGFERGEDVGIGSSIDVEFDAVFAKLRAELNALGEVYLLAFDRSAARSQMLVRAIVIAWVLVVGLAVGGWWHLERRRSQAEVALRDSESQLFQAQKMEAVGRLAGGIAHDINNQLAAVTMQCEVAKFKAAAGDPIIKRMDIIMATAAKSATLIRRLLAFSRRQPKHPEVIKLNHVIDGMEEMVTGLIGADIDFQVHRSDGLWNVLMDPAQLEQILLNLILNARDATPDGGVISVSTENRILNNLAFGAQSNLTGEYVALTVSDTGSGMPADLLDNIFEPFFTTKDVSINSGLGLAIVHAIVTQNDGHIELRSEKGIGTTFVILLPRSERAKSASATGAVFTAPQATEPVGILLVEDNEELRESTCEILKQLGYEVTTASNGEDALTIFDTLETAINLVITDVVMPRLGGKELANRLRDRRSDLPIIFVSGYTDDIILRHGVETGEVNFLPKPFTAASLSKIVESVLAKKNT